MKNGYREFLVTYKGDEQGTRRCFKQFAFDAARDTIERFKARGIEVTVDPPQEVETEKRVLKANPKTLKI